MHTILGKNLKKVILQEQNTTEEFCFKGELQIILFKISRGCGMDNIKNYFDRQSSLDYIVQALDLKVISRGPMMLSYRHARPQWGRYSS